MNELIAYYVGIGFFIGIFMMVYVVRMGGNTSVGECMLTTALWPFYLLGLVQRKVAIWILEIIK